MARRKKRKITLQPGWALYLRTSDKDAQNPELSQERQRFTIERSILAHSDLPVINEYVDLITGRTPNRSSYQQMLGDARAGLFTHVAVERADRFGRNDTEALRAIDELDALGIAVRFANHPELNPMDPDDRIIVALSFTLARRESMLTGQRIRSANDAKRNMGGFVGRPPDGYISVEDTHIQRKSYQRKTKHIEPDPERRHIWVEAWELLLEDRYTLAEICEELHKRGYRYRSGRPFVEIKPDGKRKHNVNSLSHSFHNWTYAGWICSETRNIPPKTMRGRWEPIISTEDFERGLAVLKRRTKNKIIKIKHDYLLRGMVFVTADKKDATKPGTYLHRLVGATANPNRKNGGTAYYRLDRHRVHIPCVRVEDELAERLNHVQVDSELIPLIRASYTDEIAEKLGQARPDERAEIEKALQQIDTEEARVLRLYAAGTVTEESWQGLWAEWQDKRSKLRKSLDLLDQKCESYVKDLDDALTLIEKLGILYETLSFAKKRELLRNVVKRVVVNPEGAIERVEFLPPFAYLQSVKDRVKDDAETSKEVCPQPKTVITSDDCSSGILLCGSTRT
ncbi:MAG: recombinase family protein [Chloroflexota bacterium]